METIKQISRVQDDGKVFIDMPDGPDNPCLTCGICCSHYRVSFYQGETTDVGGTVPVALTSKVNDFMACMTGTECGNGRCSALQGEIGVGGIGCAIYTNRPSVCREFPVWMDDGTPNPDCQRLRAGIGLPPLLAL
jgi:Fe-S-cluster containining protein